MGHKSGLKHTDAKGLVAKLEHAELVDRLDEGEQLDIKLLAQKEGKKAISTLKRAMMRRGKDKAPWAVATGAAKTLIEIGHGRSETREVEQKSGGLTVIINELSTGTQLERVVSGVQMAREVQSAVVAAEVVEVEQETAIVDVTPQES